MVSSNIKLYNQAIKNGNPYELLVLFGYTNDDDMANELTYSKYTKYTNEQFELMLRDSKIKPYHIEYGVNIVASTDAPIFKSFGKVSVGCKIEDSIICNNSTLKKEGFINAIMLLYTDGSYIYPIGASLVNKIFLNKRMIYKLNIGNKKENFTMDFKLFNPDLK